MQFVLCAVMVAWGWGRGWGPSAMGMVGDGDAP
jgi:hypothetical protein